MNKFYIPPDVEVLLFLSREKLANEISLRNTELSDGETVPDVTVAGPQIPGWGN